MGRIAGTTCPRHAGRVPGAGTFLTSTCQVAPNAPCAVRGAGSRDGVGVLFAQCAQSSAARTSRRWPGGGPKSSVLWPVPMRRDDSLQRTRYKPNGPASMAAYMHGHTVSTQSAQPGAGRGGRSHFTRRGRGGLTRVGKRRETRRDGASSRQSKGLPTHCSILGPHPSPSRLLASLPAPPRVRPSRSAGGWLPRSACATDGSLAAASQHPPARSSRPRPSPAPAPAPFVPRAPLSTAAEQTSRAAAWRAKGPVGPRLAHRPAPAQLPRRPPPRPGSLPSFPSSKSRRQLPPRPRPRLAALPPRWPRTLTRSPRACRRPRPTLCPSPGRRPSLPRPSPAATRPSPRAPTTTRRCSIPRRSRPPPWPRRPAPWRLAFVPGRWSRAARREGCALSLCAPLQLPAETADVCRRPRRRSATPSRPTTTMTTTTTSPLPLSPPPGRREAATGRGPLSLSTTAAATTATTKTWTTATAGLSWTMMTVRAPLVHPIQP